MKLFIASVEVVRSSFKSGLIGRFRTFLGRRKSRFLMSGGVSSVVYYPPLYILVERYSWHYISAATVAFLTQMLVNFMLHHRWTFSRQLVRLKMIILHGLYFVGALITELLLIWMMVELSGHHYMLAAFIASQILLEPSYRILQIIFQR